MRLGASWIGLALAGTTSLAVRAQEIVLTGPLASPQREHWVEAVPAVFEWTYWAAGGVVLDGGDRSSSASPLGAVGGEITAEVVRYHGFPSGWYGKTKGDAEVRVGPWLSAATRAVGGLVEGGVKFHFGGVYHASFGTWDLRLGTGYAAYERGRAPALTATFAYGVRSTLARYPRSDSERWSSHPPRPKPFAEASVARGFLTYRRGFDVDGTREIVLGIELSPTLLLPPYSLRRFGGGPP